MTSALFRHIVFGPIHSRRLGISLGVNLLPINGKWCSFDCIYCECGWNRENTEDQRLPLKHEVAAALEQKLLALSHADALPDVITFSGNGEPTLHPDFKEIIILTLSLRNQYAPKAKVCVLSNASQLHRSDVFEALLLADKRIMKIDSAFEKTVRIIDQPAMGYNLSQTIDALQRFGGDFTLQTLFVRGLYNDVVIDNTTNTEIKSWLGLIKQLKPKEVMIYTIDRKTPAQGLEKVTMSQLEAIADGVRSLNMHIEINIAG